MSFTVTLSQKIQEGQTIFGSTAQTFTCETVTKLEESVPDSSTDLEFLSSIDISELQVFYMVSDQAMTIETNSGSAAQETFTLTANKPVVWRSGDAAIFAGDVTGFYATNASGNAATLRIMYGTNV